MAGQNLTLNDILGDGLEEGLKRITAKLQELDGLMKSMNKQANEFSKAVNNGSNNRGTSGGDLAARKENLKGLQNSARELALLEKELLRLQKQKELAQIRQNEILKEHQIALQKEKKALSDRNKLLQSGAGSLKEMETRLNSLRNSYANLSKAERENIKIGGEQLKNIKQLSKETDKLRLSMGMAQQRVGGYASAIKEVGGALAGQVGLYGGIAGAVALAAGAFTGFIGKIKEYSKEWSMLKALVGTGTSKTDLQALQASSAIGADLGKTATEVTKLQIELARFGFAAKQIVSMTPEILNLSVLTGEDMAKAAEVLGANLKSFNMEADQSVRVTGVMARVFNESASGLADFREASSYAATDAKAAGVSFEFMSAMIAKLADRGIKGSRAGTALRRIFAEMAMTGKEVSVAWSEMIKKGLTVEDAFDEVGRTAMGALQILSENNKELQSFNQSLLDTDKNAKIMSDGVKVATDNLSSDFDKLTATWDKFILSVDNGNNIFSNTIRNFLKMTTGVLDGFSKLNTDFSLPGVVSKDVEKKAAKSILLPDGSVMDPKYAIEVLKIYYKDAAKLRAEAEKEMIRKEKNIGADGGTEFFGSVDVYKAKKKWHDLLTAEKYYLGLIQEQKIKTTTTTNKKVVENTEKTEAQLELIAKKKQADLDKAAKEEAKFQTMRQKYHDLLKKHGFLTTEEKLEDELKAIKKFYQAGVIPTYKEYVETVNRLTRKMMPLGLVDQSGEAGQKSIDKTNKANLSKPIDITNLKTDRFDFINALSGDTSEIWDFFGVTDKDKQAELDDALNNVIGKTQNFVATLFDTRQAAIDKEIRQREERLSEIESLIDKELDLQKEAKEKGFAYDTEKLRNLEQQKTKEEALRQEAFKKEEKLAKERMRMEQLEVASAIVSAGANLIKGWSTLPFVGRVLGVADVLALIAQFTLIKKQAASVSRAEKGTVGTFGGALHSEQGDRAQIYDGNGKNIEAERGEAYAVLSRKASKTWGKDFYDFVNNANAGKNPIKAMQNFNIFAQSDNTGVVKEIRRTNELLSGMPINTSNEYTNLGKNYIVRKTF